MIRLVLACLVPAGVTLGAWLLVGPQTIGMPRGEPMRVAGEQRMAALQAIELQGCPPKLLTGSTPEPGQAPKQATIRIVRLGSAANAVSVTDLPFKGPAGTDLVLVVDGDGRLIAAGERAVSANAGDVKADCARHNGAEPGII